MSLNNDMYKGVRFKRVDETDTRGCVVVTLQYDDEVTIYDSTDDGISHLCKIPPSSNAKHIYTIRKSWEYPAVAIHTDLDLAVRWCNTMNNNKWYISHINAERRDQRKIPWSEKTIFFVAIEWNEWNRTYMKMKKEEEELLKEKEEKRKRKEWQEKYDPKPRKRGRPKGSKNIPKSERKIQAVFICPETGLPIKRKRGRPKGSKNRPK